MISHFAGSVAGASVSRLALVKVCVLALAFAVVWLGLGAAEGLAVADGEGPTAGMAATKKVGKKKSCKRTHVLKKGKCVRKKCKKGYALSKKGKCVKKKASVPTQPKPQQPSGPNPLSDADGDGLPYKWEVKAPAAPTPNPPARPKKCKKGRVFKKGKCVGRKCRKGRILKKGRCVKKKGRKKSAKARASAVADGILAAYGAKPNRKDIFVQIDFASEALRQASTCAQFDAVYNAFATAPVSNPDGSTGIRLHLDAGKVCPSRSYDLGGSRILNVGTCPSGSAILNALRLPESRVGAFRISGFGPTCASGGDGGLADQPGVTSAVYTDGGGFGMPFMHELGHNLGLGHGMFIQPNRISVMNGRIQSSPDDAQVAEVLDYQRFSLPALDENQLSEAAGIGAPSQAHERYIRHHCPDESPRDAWLGHDGAVDWNCNTPMPQVPPFRPTIDGGLQSVDVNGDGLESVLPATGNEWLQLDYDAGGRIGLR